MTETMSLKALADAVFRRDTPRDVSETRVSHECETTRGLVRQPEAPGRVVEPPGSVHVHEAPDLEDAAAARIFSRVLGVEIWIAADERAAADLHREGVTLPVILVDEAKILAGMADADAWALLELLARIQTKLPGSRLRGVIRGPLDA
jgi:hypothetical protein